MGTVGKHIGGKLYTHKIYSGLVVPEEVLSLAGTILAAVHGDFTFNVVVWDMKKNLLRYVLSPDFDTASEPEVGITVTVDLAAGTAGPKRTYHQIWHRKHLWVMSDYVGFDVAAADAWAKEWSSQLRETADGSSRVSWHRQLTRNGIRIPA